MSSQCLECTRHLYRKDGQQKQQVFSSKLWGEEAGVDVVVEVQKEMK